MRGSALLFGLMTVGMTFGRPAPVCGQTPPSADVVGAWDRTIFQWNDWDSVTHVVSQHWRETILRLRADSTYTVQEFSDGQRKESADSDWKRVLGANPGSWLLAVDTLVTDPLVGTHRFKVSRSGDTLAMQEIPRTKTGLASGQLYEWVRIDTTQPPLTTLPKLTYAQLAGIWVTTTEVDTGTQRAKTVTDTVILRADSTWTANADSSSVCDSREGPKNAGRWYLGGSAVVFVDPRGRPLCGGSRSRWRGNSALKLQGDQLLIRTPYGQKMIYMRVSKATP